MNQYSEIGSIYSNGAITGKEQLSAQNNRNSGEQSSAGQSLIKGQSLMKGQKITGQIISVVDHIHILIGDQKVIAEKSMNPSGIPGDTMTFEVVQLLDQQIVLKSIDSEDLSGKSLIMMKRQDVDRELLQSRREQANKQLEREQNYKNIKKDMDQVLSIMTAKDFKLLENEGIDLNTYTIRGLNSALTRVKGDISPWLGKQEKDKEDVTEADIKEKLDFSNLPATEESIRKMLAALGLTKTIDDIKEETIKEIVDKGRMATIENVYKAQFATNVKGSKTEITTEVWDELLPQVEEVVSEAGYVVEKGTLDRAKWMLEEGISLTKENFDYCNRLTNFKMPSQNQILDQMIEGMKEGKAPEETNLLFPDKDQLQGVLNRLETVDHTVVEDTIRRGKPLTIKELFYTQEEVKPSTEEKPELTNVQEIEALKAQRQLEELRLKMTMDAAIRLEKQGFHIETKHLEDLVNELRTMEDNYYKNQLSEVDLEGNDYNLSIIKETTKSIADLKAFPSYILGTTLKLREQITIPTLIEEGNRLSGDVQRASIAYETLMTQPISEFGDSIQKAFRNMGPLLDEMGIENTTYNQRAAKILGYNQMEITKESIEEVKAYDLEVNQLFQNLQPAVTLRLIKDGINPLEIPIPELNEMVEKLKEEGISSDNKYSLYLHKLEKEQGISEEERKAYIGVYRLIHQVNKSDGAALGAVIKADQEVTLSHLLTAVRSTRKGSVNALINDQFGELDQVKLNNENITDQINHIHGMNQKSTNNNHEYGKNPSSYEKNKEEVTKSLLSQIEKTLSVSSIQSLLESMAEEKLNTMESSSVEGLWDRLKDLSIEKIFDHLQSNKSMEIVEEDGYEEKLKELRTIFRNSDHAIRFLEDVQLPCTTANIVLAGQVLSHNNIIYKEYQRWNRENSLENTSESSEESLQNMENLVDTLVDKDTMIRAYEDIENKIGVTLEQISSKEEVDPIYMGQLKGLSMQLSFLKKLAQKEYYQIPVKTEDGILNMNVTMIRDSGKAGKVSVSMETESLGKVKVDLTLKGNEIFGYINCTSRKAYDNLKGYRDNLKQAIEETPFNVKQLEVCIHTTGFETSLNHKTEVVENQVESVDMEKQLYQLAKKIVMTLGTMESL